MTNNKKFNNIVTNNTAKKGENNMQNTSVQTNQENILSAASNTINSKNQGENNMQNTSVQTNQENILSATSKETLFNDLQEYALKHVINEEKLRSLDKIDKNEEKLQNLDEYCLKSEEKLQCLEEIDKIAFNYAKGDHVVKDIDKAIAWYNLAIDKYPATNKYLYTSQGLKLGTAAYRALFNIGVCYYYEKHDITKALKLWRRILNNKNYSEGPKGVAAYELGCHYFFSKKHKNIAKAIEYWEMSHDFGYDEGTYILGECYFWGVGVEEDQDKACELWEEAEWNGDALYALCAASSDGIYSVDEDEFLYLISKTAYAGNVEALSNIDDMKYEYMKKIEHQETDLCKHLIHL